MSLISPEIGVSRLRFLTCLLALAGLLLAPPMRAEAPPSADAAEKALTPRLRQMLQVMKIARDRHLLRPENPQMIEGAVRGMLARLDPEAELYTPEDLRRTQVPATQLLTVGIVVKRLAMPPRSTGPAFRIVGTRDGSPAARAGLRAGDLIARIDGVPTADLLLLDLAVDRLSGTAGFVELSILRGSPGQPIDVILPREAETSQAVSLSTMPGGVVVLRVGNLNAGAARQLEQQLNAALAPLGKDFRGLVLDLRDTPAGLADEAIGVADAFLETGAITTKESRSTAAEPVQARPGDISGGKPIAVLINAGTAKAGEIVAAALHENKRATLFGGPTAGLGYTPSLVPLPNNQGALYLRTEHYLSPSGRPLDKAGIKPDIEIKAAKDDAAACREVDKPADDGEGQCVRKPGSEDAVLQAALAHLSGLAAAAQPGAAQPVTGKP